MEEQVPNGVSGESMTGGNSKLPGQLQPADLRFLKAIASVADRMLNLFWASGGNVFIQF